MKKMYHIDYRRLDCIPHCILLAVDTDCIHLVDRHIAGTHNQGFVDCCSNSDNRIDHILHIAESSDLVEMIVLLAGTNLRQVEMCLLALH